MPLLPNIDPDDYTRLADQKIFHVGEFTRIFARLQLEKRSFMRYFSTSDYKEVRINQIYKDLKNGCPVRLGEALDVQAAFTLISEERRRDALDIITNDKFIQPAYFIVLFAKEIFKQHDINDIAFSETYQIKIECVHDIILGKRVPLSTALYFVRNVNSELSKQGFYIQPSEFITSRYYIGRKSAARNVDPLNPPHSYFNWPPSSSELQPQDKLHSEKKVISLESLSNINNDAKVVRLKR